MNAKDLMLSPISVEELKQELTELFAKKTLELFSKQEEKRKDPNELLTRKETAKLLNVSLCTLYLWTKQSKLKSYGIENKVYYKKSEIFDCLIIYKTKCIKNSKQNVVKF